MFQSLMARTSGFANPREIRAGVVTGCAIAVLFSLIATIGYAANGFAATERRSGLSILEIVAAYFAGGITGGAVVGALIPLTRRKWGAPLVGFLGVLPFALAIMSSLMTRDQWFPAGAVLAVLFAAIFGAGLGSVYRS
jgi:hypothetical protein